MGIVVRRRRPWRRRTCWIIVLPRRCVVDVSGSRRTSAVAQAVHRAQSDGSRRTSAVAQAAHRAQSSCIMQGSRSHFCQWPPRSVSPEQTACLYEARSAKVSPPPSSRRKTFFVYKLSSVCARALVADRPAKPRSALVCRPSVRTRHWQAKHARRPRGCPTMPAPLAIRLTASERHHPR